MAEGSHAPNMMMPKTIIGLLALSACLAAPARAEDAVAQFYRG